MIATFKTINENLTNRQRYNLVVSCLKKLEDCRSYGTVNDPENIMSCRYGDTTVARHIMDNGEINCEGFEYGIIIDLREDMIYVDYPADYGQTYVGDLAEYEYETEEA
jgi:hypothetical protein